MRERKIVPSIVLLILISISAIAQHDNPNLISGDRGVVFTASSTYPTPPLDGSTC